MFITVLYCDNTMKDSKAKTKALTVPILRKKRNVDPLAENYRDKLNYRFVNKSESYLKNKGLRGDRQLHVYRHTSAKHAISFGRRATIKVPVIPIDLPRALQPGESLTRKTAIQYLYLAAGRPHPDHWTALGLLDSIMCSLRINKNSRSAVKKTLQDIANADGPYDPKLALGNRGRKQLLTVDSVECGIVCDALERGVGITAATYLVNQHRRKLAPPQPEVSWSTVAKFGKATGVAKCRRRGTKKSGNNNADSKWAKARLALAQQLKRQLEMKDDNMNYEPGTENERRIHLDGIAVWDENHKKSLLGFSTKEEWQIARHPETGKPCAEKDGGVFPKKKPRMQVKFETEARSLLGVAMVTGPDGVERGVRGKPFFYTNRKV